MLTCCGNARSRLGPKSSIRSRTPSGARGPVRCWIPPGTGGACRSTFATSHRKSWRVKPRLHLACDGSTRTAPPRASSSACSTASVFPTAKLGGNELVLEPRPQRHHVRSEAETLECAQSDHPPASSGECRSRLDKQHCRSKSKAVRLADAG